MWKSFAALLRKDFQLMLSSKFPLLVLLSLILYSLYINFIYVGLDQEIYPVYMYDSLNTHHIISKEIIKVDSLAHLQAKINDGYAIGIDAKSGTPEIIMLSSGIDSTDQHRAAYAVSLLSAMNQTDTTAEIIGNDNKEMKNRREITCEFLFFELAAVGFLGIASLLFKEKQMGMIRVHGVLPVRKSAFIVSKLCLFLLSDLLFSTFLTILNLGVSEGISVLPFILLQGGILSLIMALIGFLCAVLLHDFKQFSLLYLVLAVFISTPVFLAGQTGITWDWIIYHPMYHLFMSMKHAYWGVLTTNGFYYMICGLTIVLLFSLVYHVLTREMAKEG